MRASPALALLAWAGLLCPAAQATEAADGLELQFGASLLRFDFREVADNGRQLVRELGTLPGFVGRAGQTLGRWQWSAALSYYSGTVDYDGQTQAGAGFTTTSNADVARIQARALHLLDEEGRYAAGLGFGYRRWQRGIRGRGNVSGLDERFEAGDVSVDARVSVLRSPTARVDVDLQLAWPIRPQVKVDFGGLYDTQRLMLGPRLATRVSVPVSWTAGPRSRIVVEPAFEAWGFGRSATETLYRDGAPAGEVYQPQGKGYNVELNLVWAQAF